MEFDTDSDPEFMFELFGEDVESLAEYVFTPTPYSAIPLIQILTVTSEVQFGFTSLNVVVPLRSGILSWATQTPRSLAKLPLILFVLYME